ncbi:MAG TPA: extracellular solute-binding protein [Chloroflexota bacterium]|nr:extracellular solute-binding protein [Chloroflexota bacterium]
MTTRRSLLSGVTVLSGGAALAACSPLAGGGVDKIARGKSDKPLAIRWSTWGDDQNTFNSVAAPKGLALFKDSFPNLKISIEPQVGEDWPTKNYTEWIAGSGPDMTGHAGQWGVQWGREGLLWNMETAYKKDVPPRIQEDYVDWLIKIFQLPERGLVAIPMYSGTVGLMYNKSVFQRKGVSLPDGTWDWNKYRDAAIKLHDRERPRPEGDQRGNEVASFTFGRRQVRGYDRVMQRIHQVGGNYVDPKDAGKSVLNTPAAIEALQYERDANLKDKYTGIEPEYEVTRGMDYFKALSSQRFAMWEEGSFALVRFTTQVEKDVLSQLDVAPLPRGPKQKATLATNDGWSIWKQSKAIDESWELVKFLQSDEWTEINAAATGQQPARKSFQERWVKLVKQGNPGLAHMNLSAFTEAIQQNYARPIELFRKQKDSRDIIINLLNEAVYGTESDRKILNGSRSLDAAVTDAVKRINDFNALS